MTLKALVLDDDPDFLTSLAELVRLEGFEVRIATNLAGARAALRAETPSLLLSDLMLPDGTGVDLLRELSGTPDTDVVIVSGQATVDSAIEAMRLGALDYLTKPLDIPRLRSVLAHVQRTRSLREELGALRGELQALGRFGPLLGSSAPMRALYDLIARVAPTDASVFVTGESGSGKELVAQTVHQRSRRVARPFIPINCGAVPPALIESELFGHERGSFTGATQQRRGVFERAHGGTLFLDEITEMPIELQVKLLRVLETGALMRVGGDDPVRVDVRIVAASNRAPAEAVKDNKLREDLYYRLNVFPIHLPPLRERGEDVMLLAEHFLGQLNRDERTPKEISASSHERLLRYAWPGNVRELKNEVQRAFIVADAQVEMLPRSAPPRRPAEGAVGAALRVGASLADLERELILATLEHCGGDKKQAAATLGISLKTLYNRLNVYAAG